MGIPNIFQTGRSGMVASKAAIATAGHNISNANTEGYSRQKVETSASTPHAQQGTPAIIGTGTQISRTSRLNDEYIEKQIRNGTRDLSHMEEKDMALRQTEDIFNEMNGEGLNRLMSKFFNDFRKLSNEPDNEAIRESVRESSSALVSDFHRLRQEVDEVRQHIDSRLEGHAAEVNSLMGKLRDLNFRIHSTEAAGTSANDMQDERDQVLKKLSGYMDLNMHKDNFGNYVVESPTVGPLVVGDQIQKFTLHRTPKDNEGKPENALDIQTSTNAHDNVTHRITGGKLGALIETRDQTLSTILDRLDELAYGLSQSVNGVHAQGFNRNGVQNTAFFKPVAQKERAAESIDLSDAVKASANNIATAAQPDSPSDNRIALAISAIQGSRLMNDGKTTMDDFYNSIVSDVGTAGQRNRSGMNQQKDIMTQLGHMRDQISGVSIDEETANLMQFQHTFDASAKLIQVADEMLKTVLELKR